MIVTKKSLPRRTMLRGMGAAIALPLLDAMVPASTALAKTAAAPVPRLGIFGMANGMFFPDFCPKGVGTTFELSPILAPLAPLKDHMVVVTGLSNTAADGQDVGGGPHARAIGTFLSGVKPKRTEGADVALGKTIDQYAADVIGQDTQLTSLELALESGFTGNCDQGYSCIYLNTFSWRGPTAPLPMENNPRLVFERLFGDAPSVTARTAQARKDRSILDWMGQKINTLQTQLGPADRERVDEYLSALRDVEKRIQSIERHAGGAFDVALAQPVGIPDSSDDHVKLMTDMQFLAYQADITRVVSFQLTREQSSRIYPFLGVPDPHHVTSHHNGSAALIAGNTKINAYFASIVGRLAEKMRVTQDGDGTLLDHSLLMYSATLGDANIHSPHNLPCVLLGGGCGRVKGGRHIAYEQGLNTPFMNLGVSLVEKLGGQVERIGDSSGRIAEL